MIKAIILDKGYRSKNVVVKFKGNYMCVSFAYFLNSLCRRHISDYQVRTVHFEDISNKATVELFEILLICVAVLLFSLVKSLRIFGCLTEL